MMADMGKEPGPKPWWKSDLDWNLTKELETTLRMGRDVLRNIPQTLSAHKLGKASPLDELEPDPVVKIGPAKVTRQVEATKAKVASAPRVIPPPPPLPPQRGIRAINMPPAISKPAWSAATQPNQSSESSSLQAKMQKYEKTMQDLNKREDSKPKVSLENLLDPDFCDY